DLAAGGTVQGSGGSDILVINGTSLNLTSTTLTSVNILQAGESSATTFTVNQADLGSSGSTTGASTVKGSSGTDTLVVIGNSMDLSSTALSSVEILKTTSSSNTTFTLNQNDLSPGGSVLGSTGTDTLIAAGNSLDLSSTMLSSVEKIMAGKSTATTFTVDQADLAPNGSVIGSSGNDTLATAGTQLNLTSTALSSIEILSSSNTSGTTFTLDQLDFAGISSISGNGVNDTLVVISQLIDLSTKSLTGIDTVKAGLNIATTFTVNQADLASVQSIFGSTGSDSLVTVDTQLDLRGITLSSVENLQAGTTRATTFIVNQNDLAPNGSVTGNNGTDTLETGSSMLDLTSTTLSSVEKLQAISSGGTTFKIDAADMAELSSIGGSTGADTLIFTGTDFNLTAKGVTSIETRQAGIAGTVFTVSDPTAFQHIIGSTAVDSLIATTTAFDLSGTTLSSVEKLQAGSTSTTGTTFT